MAENDAATFDQDGLVRMFARLVHNSKSHDFRCKVCVHVKAKDVFVTGKDCAQEGRLCKT